MIITKLPLYYKFAAKYLDQLYWDLVNFKIVYAEDFITQTDNIINSYFFRAYYNSNDLFKLLIITRQKVQNAIDQHLINDCYLLVDTFKRALKDELNMLANDSKFGAMYLKQCRIYRAKTLDKNNLK